MEKWVITQKGAPFARIAEKFGIHPVVARLIRNRDIIGDEEINFYLNGTIADLYDGMLMRDMDKAVDILMEKIHEGEKIRVIGDYDIDGINASYILLKGIRMLGGRADVDIPDRMLDGYGLNKTLIERAFDEGVDTIITCDNGIAASDEIAYGKSLGMTIVVTDHHEVPFEETGEETDGGIRYILPPADAVVDPKRKDCAYPFKELCGTAVAYKLLEALFEALGRDADEIDDFMENVAIATVGDVMDLTGENRIFVKQGLDMLKRTKNPGLRSLIECTGTDAGHLSAYHIGFVIGPCLNASGRLDTAKRALELLCAKDKREADILAGDLKALNDSRKEMTAQAVDEAVRQVEETGIRDDKVLVIFLPGCHESLAGIVAGRIREKYYKPVFVLTRSNDGIKGSGRSIDAYHMHGNLTKCRHLLTKFGGHKLAAGVSLKECDLEEFRRELNRNAGLTEDDLTPKVVIDMRLPLEYITEELIEGLEVLEPFGKGNPKPLFAEKDLEVLGAYVCGKNNNVLRFRVKDNLGTQMDAVYFGDAPQFLECIKSRENCRIRLAYYPSINVYQGRKTIQIVVQHYSVT